MTGRKMEGNEQQRRERGRQARESGSTPSAELLTKGASKQTHRTGQKEPHQERLAANSRGKQQSPGPQPAGRPTPNEGEAWSRPRAGQPSVPNASRKTINLTQEQGEIYETIADLESRNEPAYLSRIATAAGRPEVQTRQIIGDLLSVNLVQEVAVPGQPDLGFQYVLTAKT